MFGLRRAIEKLPAGITAIRGDLNRPDTLRKLPRKFDAVVYTATPGSRTPEGYRAAYVDGLERLLERVDPGRLIFVSSTAVYGQDSGERVDEDSPTDPRGFNGRLLLEAERTAQEAGGHVMRFSGIYGPGREYLLHSLRNGPVECRRDPPVWTNRIHAEDCAGALQHLLELERPAPVWVASDARPSPRFEVLEWLAAQMNVDGPVEHDEASGSGKRVCADRLFASGFRLQYPDYRSGYLELLE